MTLKIVTTLFFAVLSVTCHGQTKLETSTIGSLEIIKPSTINLIKMLEMSSSEWLAYCKKVGYNEGSSYRSPSPGFLLVSKGEIRKGGSHIIEKLGTNTLIYEWYHFDSDPETIFKELSIELENKIFYHDAESVAWEYVFNNIKYGILLLSNGTHQIGVSIQRVPTK